MSPIEKAISRLNSAVTKLDGAMTVRADRPIAVSAAHATQNAQMPLAGQQDMFGNTVSPAEVSAKLDNAIARVEQILEDA